MAQACARLCHQHRHLLNDVGGNGESGESRSLSLLQEGSPLEARGKIVYTTITVGDFTFWLSPWLSLLAEAKH